MSETYVVQPGKYKHFKGKYYEVYCVAVDVSTGDLFVLYRQDYGDRSFWLRPVKMFTEFVAAAASQRFSFVDSGGRTDQDRIQELIGLIEAQTITIKHSETEQQYFITIIDTTSSKVQVYPANGHYSSGYLTDFELAKRMGFISCRINGQTNYYKCEHPTIDDSRLLKIRESDDIEENTISFIRSRINPCSIDLQIAKAGFLSAKRKTVDPQSIEHVSSAEELWKKAKVYCSKKKSSEYIKLRPGKTVLTHTRERIKIPDDCAGKIEIKSTFARLSIAITSGDFCNPGYDGHYPLEITNNGKHTIIIHTMETMAQLMIIPLQGPVLEKYAPVATHKNKDGYDDGTPFSFWRERSIKTMRKESGAQEIVDIYSRILNTVSVENTDDLNGFRERFENNFMPFCQKRISNPKYQNNSTGFADAEHLLKAYAKKEKQLKNLFSNYTKIGAFVLGLVFALASDYDTLKFIFDLIGKNLSLVADTTNFFVQIVLRIIAGILFLFAVFSFVSSPKTFCTFEKIDLNEILQKKSTAPSSPGAHRV